MDLPEYIKMLEDLLKYTIINETYAEKLDKKEVQKDLENLKNLTKPKLKDFDSLIGIEAKIVNWYLLQQHNFIVALLNYVQSNPNGDNIATYSSIDKKESHVNVGLQIFNIHHDIRRKAEISIETFIMRDSKWNVLFDLASSDSLKIRLTELWGIYTHLKKNYDATNQRSHLFLRMIETIILIILKSSVAITEFQVDAVIDEVSNILSKGIEFKMIFNEDCQNLNTEDFTYDELEALVDIDANKINNPDAISFIFSIVEANKLKEENENFRKMDYSWKENYDGNDSKPKRK